jgi:hypothetical protein
MLAKETLSSSAKVSIGGVSASRFDEEIKKWYEPLSTTPTTLQGVISAANIDVDVANTIPGGDLKVYQARFSIAPASGFQANLLIKPTAKHGVAKPWGVIV